MKNTLGKAVLATFIAILPVAAHAGDSDSASFGLSLRVPFVCKAEILSISQDTSGMDIEIRELCNGGAGYNLELLHDGQGIDRIVYNNNVISYGGENQTVLATRNGAYHGRRLLRIETTGVQSPEVFDVTVRPFAGRL